LRWGAGASQYLAELRHEPAAHGHIRVCAPNRLAGGDRDLRVALTLKAVSRRTGIPAATLRTWERRYQLTRPLRSPTGYRLYSEEDVTRILQVKYLLEQGVRVSEATAALDEAAGDVDAVLGELDPA
jgi:MerR HTH family regulatory protein